MKKIKIAGFAFAALCCAVCTACMAKGADNSLPSTSREPVKTAVEKKITVQAKDAEKQKESESNEKEEVRIASSGKEKASCRNVAYYTSWSAYARNVFVEDIDASLLTHINFAFANLNSNGEIVVGDSWVDTDKPMGNDTWDTTEVMGHFGQLREIKKKYPHLKVLISVGGWTWSKNFSDVAADAGKRKKFAASAAAFVKKYGFDGVDIDWEFPVEGGEGITHRPEDKGNYTKLLKETRAALEAQGKKDKKNYLLTIAGGPNVSFTKNTEIKKIMEYIDFINIMAYDYHGGWESTTNHNAPLYVNSKDPKGSQGLSVENTVNAYLKAGAEPADLNLGLAFYGRGWTNVSEKGNNGLFKSGSTPVGTGFGLGTWEGGVFDYWDLEKNYVGKKGFKRYFDQEAKVPYLFDGSTFISYDDKESILEKLSFAKKKGLGGVMFWEFSGDKEKTLQKAAADYLGIKSSGASKGDTKKEAEKTSKPKAAEKPAATKKPTSGASQQNAPQWKKETVYTAGDRVTYKKKTYQAKWWTQGENPAESGEWGVWEKTEGK